MSYKIYDRDDLPYFTVVHNGYEVFGMSLQSVKPESMDWVANHISEKISDQIDRAYARGYMAAQSDIRKALGFK